MRKDKIAIVPDWGGRDKGRHYFIQEMPASAAVWWLDRAMLLLRGSGAHLPENIAGRGYEFIAIFGINVLLNSEIAPEKLKPLLDELMTCVSMIRDPKARDQRGKPVVTPIVSENDIMEPRTIYWLRAEVLSLHLGFSIADALSALHQTIQTSMSKPDASENTQTSPPESAS
jgi:hypothetical protein